MEIKIEECLKIFEIYYKNKKLNFNSLDKISINLIYDVFNNANYKNNLTITLEEEITTVYILLIVGISSYYKNMRNPESDILDILCEGDKVCYKRNIYIFKGFNKIGGNKYIKLLGNDRVITNIIMKNAYELTLYNGEANKIKNSKFLPYNRTNLTKLLISKIMKEDICNLNGIINESNVIVIKPKEKFLDILNNIEVVVDGQKVLFTELFCTAYWASADGDANIIRNTIKEDILLNITNNISTALDLIMNDSKIKNVIVIGEKAYKDNLDTELRRISFIQDIKKILLFDTWQSNDSYDFFMNKDNNYEVRAITKDTILDNVNLYDDKEFKSESVLQLLQYRIAENLVNKSIEVKEIKNSKCFNEDIKNLSKVLKQLCNYIENSDYTLSFVKISYSLCKKIERTIIPLRYCQENKDSIKLKIKNLEEIKLNFHETRSEYDFMKQIIDLFNKIIGDMEYENKKFLSVKEIEGSKGKILLVIKNKEEIKSINRFLTVNRLNNITVKIFNKDINYSDYDVVILSFYDENNNLIKNNYISELQIIGYNREFNKYRWLINKNTNMLKLMSGSNEINIKYEFESNEKIIDNNHKYEENIEIEEEIKSILDKNFIRLITGKEYDSDNKQSSNSKSIAKQLVLFRDGKYAFLSGNYSCNCLSKMEDDICTKSIDEIEAGDKLIFVVNERSGKEDIVKDTIERLLKYKEFRELYGEYFQKNMYWKNCLIKYMQKNNFDERDIANRFRIHGHTITSLAISNWINGNIIGPQNSDNLKILADIIGDDKFKREINSIILSCKQVRSIQIKVKKSIAKIIIDSVISNDADDSIIYKLVNNVIGDFEKYAYVGEVEFCEYIEKEIATQCINRVSEGIEI